MSPWQLDMWRANVSYFQLPLNPYPFSKFAARSAGMYASNETTFVRNKLSALVSS